jgi:hypothetical protein
MSIVLDCTQSPSVEAIKAAGAVAVSRYLSWEYRWGGTTHSYINPKVIQKPEYDHLASNGIGVVLNWEFDARDWLGGADRGHEHATEAVRQAKMLGCPPNQGAAILGSADFDMTWGQWTSAGQAYATAFAAVVRGAGYLTGPYGPWDVLEWVHNASLGDIFWQAGMSWAWSAGRNRDVHPVATLFQQKHLTVGGIDCDVDVILKPDFGAYPKPGAVVVPVVLPPTRTPDLLVDGVLGRNTVSRWQNIMGTPVDGFITQPPGRSNLVKAVQKHLNAAIGAGLSMDGQGICQDGHTKFLTTRALQRYLGTPQDGVLSLPTSMAVKALQKKLNTGTF